MPGEPVKAKPAVLVPLVSPLPIDETTIPRRPWLIPGLLLRRHVSVLVAPPGSGKSLLTLQVSLMMAEGKSWGGWHPRGSFKVLVINSEDDADEMRRRLAAAVNVMGYDGLALRDRVQVADAPQNIVIARADVRTKIISPTAMFNDIIATIKAGGFDCVVIDPFAETFAGDENSNNDLKWAALLWRDIARLTNAAVLLVHHTRKFSNEPGEMDASRGGGSLLGVARVVSTVFSMSEREAKAFDLKDYDERHKYLRFDDAKANLSLVTFKARWFEKHTYKLDNAGDDEPADEVGVLKPWKPPSIFDKIDAATARTILIAIDAGPLDDAGAPTGDMFTLTRQGGSKRWAGQVVEDHIENSVPKDVQKLLDAWHANGVINEVERVLSNSKGKPRKGLRVNMSRLPGTAIDGDSL
jgi:hypothetical protein